MKIFIDFDRVAFNTDKLYNTLNTEGAPESGTIESLSYLDGLEEGNRTKDLLFEDFVEFAIEQKAIGNELILVSSAAGFSADWELEYQKEKIERSGMHNFVTKIITVGEGKADAIRHELQEGEEAMFIEDSPHHLTDVARLRSEGFNIECIQMLRTGERMTNTGPESVEALPEFRLIKHFGELMKSAEG